MGIIKGNQDNFEELTSKGTVLVFFCDMVWSVQGAGARTRECFTKDYSCRNRCR